MELTPQKIIDIISSITKKSPESISLQHTLRGDLGMDSLQALELIVILEEDYNIIVPQTDLVQVKTPEQLWSVIQANKGASSPTV